jgi:hypothetical protein
MPHFLSLSLDITCGVSWMLAYIFIIIRGIREKTYGMPFLALAFNICWEVLFATVFNNGMFIYEVVTRICVVFDLIILFTYFKYGIREWPTRLNKNLFYPFSILVLVVTFGFIYLWCRAVDPTGTYMAYIQNLMMSLLFINMLNKRNGLKGQSAGIAFTKMTGTLAATLGFVYLRMKFVTFTGALIFLLDMVYLLMVVNQGRLVWPIRVKLKA